MALTNSVPLDSISLDAVATAGQLTRLNRYARDCYGPINYQQQGERLVVLLQRFTTCTETGKRWSGRIEATMGADGKVIGSTVYPAEVVRLADADQPAPGRQRKGKPKPEQAQTDAPQFWQNQLVKIPSGQRAWVDRVLEDGKIAVTVEGVGNDVYPAHLLTPVETEPPAPEPEPTEQTGPFCPGQRVRFCEREFDELSGTLATVERVGNARLLVNSDELGQMTVDFARVEPVELEQAQTTPRRRRPASTSNRRKRGSDMASPHTS